MPSGHPLAACRPPGTRIQALASVSGGAATAGAYQLGGGGLAGLLGAGVTTMGVAATGSGGVAEGKQPPQGLVMTELDTSIVIGGRVLKCGSAGFTAFSEV